MNTHQFVEPYPRPAYDAPLADWDPRCLECGKWPTDCDCNSLEPEEETH